MIIKIIRFLTVFWCQFVSIFQFRLENKFDCLIDHLLNSVRPHDTRPQFIIVMLSVVLFSVAIEKQTNVRAYRKYGNTKSTNLLAIITNCLYRYFQLSFDQCTSICTYQQLFVEIQLLDIETRDSFFENCWFIYLFVYLLAQIDSMNNCCKRSDPHTNHAQLIQYCFGFGLFHNRAPHFRANFLVEQTVIAGDWNHYIFKRHMYVWHTWAVDFVQYT